MLSVICVATSFIDSVIACWSAFSNLSVRSLTSLDVISLTVAWATCVMTWRTAWLPAKADRILQDQPINVLCTHSQTVTVFQMSASTSALHLDLVKIGHFTHDISNRYISIFKLVTNHLNEERCSSTAKSEDAPSVLFYLASIFMCRFLNEPLCPPGLLYNDSNYGQEVASLLEALAQYRTWAGTMSLGQKTSVIKTRFMNAGKQYWWLRDHMEIFSDEWWGYLFKIGHVIELKATQQGTYISSDTLYSIKCSNQSIGPTLAEESVPSNPPNTSSQGGNGPENMEGSVITPSSPLTTPSTNTHPVSDQIQVLRAGPESASSIGTASRSDTGDNDKGRHSPSGVLDTSNHTTSTSENPNLINNPPFSSSELSLPDPGMTPRPDSGQAAGGVAREVSLPAQAPASSVGTSLLTTAHEQVPGSGPQLEAHIAVDVGVMTVTEHVELGATGSGDGLSQGRPTSGDVVISIPPAS